MIKNEFVFLLLLSSFSLILYAAETKKFYKAELMHYKQCFGFIDIPYNEAGTHLVINPGNILAEIEKRQKNSHRSLPSISTGFLINTRLYDNAPVQELPVPNEKNPLKFFLEYRLDSGSYSRNFFVFATDENNQVPQNLKEGDTISITREFQVFKDPFDQKLFVKLTTHDPNEDFAKQIELGDYKIISSNGEEIITNKKIVKIENNSINETNTKHTLSSYTPSIIVVLLLLGVTNFCSYKLGIKKNISTDVNAKK